MATKKVVKKAVKKSAKKSAHTPKADAAKKKAAKIVKVKKELAKEVKMEEKPRKRTVRERIDEAVGSVKGFIDPTPTETEIVHDDLDIVVADSASSEPINSLDELIAAAWDDVRGDDPPLESVAPDFVGILHAHADSALKGNAQEGDSQIAQFERAIQRLRPRFKGE